MLVVDDGSTDRTAEIARDAGAIVLSHPFNLGIGGAVQSGYRYAYLHGYDVAVQVDGDGQHDPDQLPELERALHGGEAEMVWGSRFLEGAGYQVHWTRRIGQRIFARLVSLITREPVSDPTSGFRMTNRRGIELFARDYPHDFPEVEAILMVHAHDMSMQRGPGPDAPARDRQLVARRPQRPATTWRGCCWRSSSASSAAARFPPPGDDWLATPPSEALEGTTR